MKIKTVALFSIATTLASLGQLEAISKGASFGIVDFGHCIMESKHGKKEQSGLDALKNQIQSLLEDAEKQLTEVSNKLQDQDYMDSLSPEAENELKARYQALSEEMARYQNQYYQVLNQANMKVVQTMSGHVSQAAQEIAKELKIPLVVQKEAAYYYDPNFDMTQLVIERMNQDFENQAKKEPTKSTTSP